MTLGDAFGLSDERERWLTRVLQAGLVGITIYGLATLRVGMAVTAGAALGVTFLPAVLRREYGYAMDAGLVLLITLSVAIHVLGSLGPYQWFSWYDEVAHTVSAVLVAGIGYGVLRAFERHSREIDVVGSFRSVFVVVFVLAFGVIWEVLEFGAGELSRLLGVESPLVVYGIDDIVTDLLFNAVGGVIVALWGGGYFDDFVPLVTRWLDDRDGE